MVDAHTYRNGDLRTLTTALLLVAELEHLLVTNYEIRTGIRALLHLPIYHMILMLLTIVGMMRWAQPERFATFYKAPYSKGWLATHVGAYLVIRQLLGPIWQATESWPGAAQSLLWLMLGLLLLATWFLALLPARRWAAFAREHRAWFGLAVTASVVTPYVAEFTSRWWVDFASVTFTVTEVLLSVIYPTGVSDPTNLVLGSSHFFVRIEPGCSGYEGMGLVALLMSAYLAMKHKELRFPAACWLVPVGMIAAYLANFARLVALIVIGTELSPAIAMRGFHSQAGWIAFTVVGLGLIAVTERQGWFRRTCDVAAGEPPATYPSMPYLAPLMALIFGTMLSQAFSAGFNAAYGIKVLITGAVLWHFRKVYAGILATPRLTAVGGGLAVYGLWVALVQPSEAPSPFSVLPTAWAQAWIFVRSIGAVVIVPLAEELGFRGYLMRRLQAANFEAVPPQHVNATGLIVSSLAFGAVHNEWLAGTLAGLVYGWLATRPGYLGNCILAHAVTNLCLTLQVLTREDWWLWS